MSAIDNIISIAVQLQAQAVPQPSFAIPLIMGPSNRFSELVRYYTGTAAMLADGFLTSDPEYIRVAEALEQDLVPTQVGVGKYTAPVAQVETVSVGSIVNTTLYRVTLNGVNFDYTSDGSATGPEIQAGLIAAINGGSQAPVLTASAGSGNDVVVTSDVAGLGFTIAIGANLTVAHTTANHSITDDIAALQLVSDLWYGLSICSQAASDIAQVAAYVETQRKLFVADTNDAAVLTTSTTDVASVLKGKGYKRTAAIYAGTANDGRAAAWLGGQLPQVPGASTWKFKSLRGITPDVLTQTQRNNTIGISTVPAKNCNIYETVGGVPITEEGFTSGGQYIDVTVGIDWFESTLQTNLYALLVDNPKIPYTNAGSAIVENAIRQTIKQGISNGFIDGGTAFTVTVDDVSLVASNTRAQRISPNFKFSFRLAGAFHYIVVQGTVTV